MTWTHNTFYSTLTINCMQCHRIVLTVGFEIIVANNIIYSILMKATHMVIPHAFVLHNITEMIIELLVATNLQHRHLMNHISDMLCLKTLIIATLAEGYLCRIITDFYQLSKSNQQKRFNAHKPPIKTKQC